MKWKCPGHEFDNLFNEYCELLKSKNNQFCVFGAGNMGRKCIEFLKAEGFMPLAIIDNDERKYGDAIEGIEIVSLCDYKKRFQDCLLVLAVSTKYTEEIENQLSKEGLEEKNGYIKFNDLMIEMFPIIHLYKEDYLHLDVVELAVTERCTLKCKKCSHGCAHVPRDYPDLDIDLVKLSADEYFANVDYVNEFYLIGGETFLYKDLVNAIRYIGGHYRNRINRFIITTNGTIIPTNKTLEVIKEYNMVIYISNYSVSIPRLKKQYNKLCEVLTKYGIEHYLSKEERTWFDYGFDYVDNKFHSDVVEKIHDTCFTPCREIRGSRFYFCIQARCVSENMHFDVDDKDYLELSNLPKKNRKKIIYEYSRGYCEKGYIDMCNYCNGSESLNYLIPAAEQLL